jgi:hypothetical protein
MSPFPRLTPALLVLILLSASPVLAQTHRGTTPQTVSFAEALRGSASNFMARLWSYSGCDVDPFGGHCGTANRPPLTSLSGNSGCGVDPFGAQCTKVQTDSGCGLDPFGGHCG